MYIIQWWFVLLSLIFMVQSQSCLNSSGQQVDWWFILKMPRSSSEDWSGLEYFYCDSVNDCKEFLLQEDNLDMSDSALMKTIKTIDFTDTNVVSMLWSDQPQKDVTYSNHAHSKGIMSARLGGDQKAFIIAHSTPRFPKLNDEYNIDDKVNNNFVKNGQHFLCLSTTTNDINDYLAYQYYLAEIQIYKVSATPGRNFKNNYQNLFLLWSSKKPGRGEPHYNYIRFIDDFYSKVSFLTRSSSNFQIYSKNQKFEQDFYAEIVAPDLKQDLIMETWVRKRADKGLDKPECTKLFKTSSNEQVQFQGKKNNQDITFTYLYTKDHSKYGITLPKDSKDSSYISINYSNPSLKGQIFTNIHNVRIKENQYQNEDDITNTDDEEIVDNNTDDEFLRRKRKRDYSEDDIPQQRKRKIEKKVKYVCVSDLNRQESQWERGGLVYCFQNDNLWNHINKAFIGKQICKD